MLKTSIAIEGTKQVGLINILTIDLTFVTYLIDVQNSPITEETRYQIERFNELSREITKKIEIAINEYFDKVEDDMLPF